MYSVTKLWSLKTNDLASAGYLTTFLLFITKPKALDPVSMTCFRAPSWVWMLVSKNKTLTLHTSHHKARGASPKVKRCWNTQLSGIVLHQHSIRRYYFNIPQLDVATVTHSSCGSQLAARSFPCPSPASRYSNACAIFKGRCCLLSSSQSSDREVEGLCLMSQSEVCGRTETRSHLPGGFCLGSLFGRQVSIPFADADRHSFPRTLQVALRLPVNRPRRQAWVEDSPPRRRNPLPSPWAAAVGSKGLAMAGSRHNPKPSQACLMPLPRTSPITTWASQRCREHKTNVEKDRLTLVSFSEFSIQKVGSF